MLGFSLFIYSLGLFWPAKKAHGYTNPSVLVATFLPTMEWCGSELLVLMEGWKV